MNLSALESRVKRMYGVMYRAKFPERGVEIDIPGFEEAKLRINKFLKVLREHAHFMKKRQERIDRVTAQYERLEAVAKIVNEGHTILAFDVERDKDKNLQEVGVSTYNTTEGIKSYNLKLVGSFPRRATYEFGQTEELFIEDLLERLHTMAKDCHCYVGHSINYDLGYLRDFGAQMPFKPVLDTHFISILTDLEGGSLTDLASIFGIETYNPHCGGNDARYNMELILAMIKTYV